MNYEYQELFEYQPEYEYEGEFDQEMYENELAHELLSVQSEEELDQFLGGLVRGAMRGARALYNSPLGQKIKQQAVSGLKSVGRQALPALGRTVGGHFFGQTGANIGGRLGNMAVRGLGLEFEGASPQDRRFEASRRLVKVARAASRRIAAHASSGAPITAGAVRGIIVQTARRWFPDLPATGGNDNYSSGDQRRGSWVRRGNQIILYGA